MELAEQSQDVPDIKLEDVTQDILIKNAVKVRRIFQIKDNRNNEVRLID